VTHVEETPVVFQLDDQERRIAERLASADPRVRRFLRRRPLNPLTRLYFPREDSRHRFALVFARPSASERYYVVVDLSERRVTAVLTHAEFVG